MKKLTILVAALAFLATAATAQVTQLTVINKKNCNIYYNVVGDYTGNPCPGSVTSRTYLIGPGGFDYYSDPSQAVWTFTPGDLLLPSDEIHYVQFYNTDDPSCITAYQVGPCSPMSTSVGPIAILDLSNCAIICDPNVNITWTSTGPNSATVEFN